MFKSLWVLFGGEIMLVNCLLVGNWAMWEDLKKKRLKLILLGVLDWGIVMFLKKSEMINTVNNHVSFT